MANSEQADFFWNLLSTEGQRPLAVETAGGLPAHEVFAFYREAYISRLRKSLDAVFGDLHQLKGPEFYRTMCLDFIAATPSTEFDVNLYGAGLPDWLRARGDSESADFAEFLWWNHKLSMEVEHIGSSAENLMTELASLTEDFFFDFVPALKILTFATAPFRLWQSLHGESAELELAPKCFKVDNAQAVALFLADGEVQTLELSHEMAQLILRLQGGQSFFSGTDGISTETVQEFFATIGSRGWCKGLRSC